MKVKLTSDDLAQIQRHYEAYPELHQARIDINRLLAHTKTVEAQRSAAEAKWMTYEREYILPCFKWAQELNIDLWKLVAEGGGNCVQLLIAALRDRWLDQLKESNNEREILIYWLLRCYQSGHREGWEEGPSTDETMDGLLSVLANRHYDPTNDKEIVEKLLREPPRY